MVTQLAVCHTVIHGLQIRMYVPDICKSVKRLKQIENNIVLEGAKP